MYNFFQLHTENFDECRETIKNIFWMYQDMIRSYGGFGHNIDFETVNYEKFILVEIIDEGMNGFNEEVEMLRQGSLVALCCEVQDMLDEMRRDDRVYNFIKELTTIPEIKKMPFENDVLTSMLLALEEKPGDYWETLEFGKLFSKNLENVYKKFVINYFKRLLVESESRF
ncbi:hypothetical protein [Gottfriedia acidiceleris]|uniref:hypothetical protein n=1 Tax=Gottfriedia acidiceleris TaxID=371036 RepID=UPI000B436E68|nr:hypothetical protein [Gottfriedia acidiceleris]